MRARDQNDARRVDVVRLFLPLGEPRQGAPRGHAPFWRSRAPGGEEDVRDAIGVALEARVEVQVREFRHERVRFRLRVRLTCRTPFVAAFRRRGVFERADVEQLGETQDARFESVRLGFAVAVARYNPERVSRAARGEVVVDHRQRNRRVAHRRRQPPRRVVFRERHERAPAQTDRESQQQQTGALGHEHADTVRAVLGRRLQRTHFRRRRASRTDDVRHLRRRRRRRAIGPGVGPRHRIALEAVPRERGGSRPRGVAREAHEQREGGRRRFHRRRGRV